MNIKRKKLVLKVITIFFAFLLFFYAGYGYGVRYGTCNSSPSYILNSSKNQSSKIDFSLFWETWNKVTDLYNGSYDAQSMVYGAISGMVSSLNDPYSEFLKPSDNEALSADLSGEFQGIGAELIMNNGVVTVVSPISSSPAEKAGIKPKDIILEVDGQSTSNQTLTEVVGKIRGVAGTEVKLKIIHADANEPVEISVVRDTIKIDSVSYETSLVSGKKIAILKISQFGDDTTELANKYADQINSDNISGIIVDLRNNPGGYLDSGVSIANLFLEKDKTVVSEVDKFGAKSSYKTDVDPKLLKYPLIVLVNGGSASASEIFTGAMKDNGRAKIIGEQTFGKGCVQQVVQLSGGSALKITIAKWITPNGTEINEVGITPDIVLSSGDNSSDSQLEKAKTEIVK